LKRKPFLFEVRDLWPDFAIQVGVLKNPMLIRLSRWLERFLYHGADQLIANSPGFVEHIQMQGGDNVCMIPNGVDTAMFDPYASGLELRREHALQGKFIVMYAGAHGMSNDLEVVLEAARLLEERKELAILLVGDGKEKPALIARCSEMGLQNVIFLPPVAKVEMAGTLAAADACLAILKPIAMYATVYPNKVFDYMAAGRPVLLAIDGVIRKVVEEAGCGVFIPPGNPAALAEAIQKLAGDREQARAMGMRGRACAEARFDRADLADQLAEIIEGMK
jgi:glycosyltransferase involved in cell wall biosynthesis